MGTKHVVQWPLWTAGWLMEITDLLNTFPLLYSVSGNILLDLECWAHATGIPTSSLAANTKKCKEVLYLWRFWKINAFKFQASNIRWCWQSHQVSHQTVKMRRQGNSVELLLSFTKYTHPQNKRYWWHTFHLFSLFISL